MCGLCPCFDSSQEQSPTHPQAPHCSPQAPSPICRVSRPSPSTGSAFPQSPCRTISPSLGSCMLCPCAVPGGWEAECALSWSPHCQLAASSHPPDVKAEFFLLFCSKSTKLSPCLLQFGQNAATWRLQDCLVEPSLSSEVSGRHWLTNW